jgi:hypothetical protein
MTNTFTDLFWPRPEQWGLRGDPFLWDELSACLAAVVLPNSAQEVISSLEEAIMRLTGATFDGQDAYFVERYGGGGMSGGHISRQYWASTGIPLLVSRFKEV